MSRTTEEMKERLEALEKKVALHEDHLKDLGTAFNSNNHVWADAFDLLDMRFAATHRILDDYEATQGLRVLRRDGKIDWEKYYTEYVAMTALSQFLMAYNKAFPPTVIESDVREDDVVFGGA